VIGYAFGQGRRWPAKPRAAGEVRLGCLEQLQPIPLNIFQHVTRQWDALHPYNAAQLMQLEGTGDIGRIEEAWRSALRDAGLGAVQRNGRKYVYVQAGDAMVRVPSLNLALDDFLTGEMNRPFTDGDRLPFRPFVLHHADSHYLGVVYHHWIADSVSIRSLLREWFFRIYDPGRAGRGAFGQPTAGYWGLFGADAAGWDLGRGVLDVFRWSSRLKRVRRVESRAFPDLKTRFGLHRLPDGLVDQLLPVARAAGATLNDLFLAAMAVACDRYVAAPANEKRSDLALGVIVDLRGRAQSLGHTFGLFLGFTNVLCGVKELGDWDRLIAHLALQNRQNKRSAAAEASMLRMLGARIVGGVLSRRRLLEFYRKRVPLAAGISNVNLNRTWVSEYHPSPILDYIRVSPTGPMLPVVFTPSTLGRRMHFGLTHRVSVLPEEGAGECADLFASTLSSVGRIV
jgi:hypothetical protein